MMRHAQNERGMALVVGLIVLFAVAGLSAVYVAITTNSLVRVQRQEQNYVASNVAEAAIEYVLKQTGSSGLGSQTYDLNQLANALVSGATASATVIPVGSRAKIRATATYNGQSETIEVMLEAGGSGVWDAAIFAGRGQTGAAINGNVAVAGSMVILGDGEPFTDTNGNGQHDAGEPYTDINGNGVYDAPLTSDSNAVSVSLEGNSGVQNTYDGMNATLSTRVPALSTRQFGGETVSTLNTKVHIKRGKMSLSGSASVGSANVTGNSVKETVDGVYVTDGIVGAASVYSDNGTSNPYNLSDDLKFPYLGSPYTDPDTGTSYSSFSAYLDANSLLISDSIDGTTDGKIVISANTEDFSASNGLGSISWNKTSRTMTISGIVRMNVDLDLGVKNAEVNYTGTGSLYTTGDVRIHSDVLSQGTFPTTSALGVIAGNSIYLATGSGESQVSMTGAFYAQNKIVSSKQNQIAGSFVSGYFDMGSNVPSIFHVPSLSAHLPPAMPGGGENTSPPTAVSWRRVAAGQ